MAAALVGVVGGRTPTPKADGVFILSPNRPDAVIAVTTAERVVALTFDDGPDPAITPRVLAILERQHAHATFFVLGRQVQRYPALVLQTQLAGNEIANHTYDHPHADGITPEHLATELRRTAAAIADSGVDQSAFFRPPKGLFDAQSAGTVRRLGYQTVGWTVTLDKFVRRLGVASGVDALLARLWPGGIILAHDAGRAKTTIEALPLLLSRLASAGYRVVTMSELFASAGAAGSGEPLDSAPMSHSGS